MLSIRATYGQTTMTSTVSNENTRLTILTSFDGPQLTFDIPGLSVGIAEYPEGPTGCTVFRFAEQVLTAVDVRGGWVGMTQEFGVSDAICLTGGSLIGLESVYGVTAGIFAERGYSLEHGNPVVNGAVIYDYRRRGNTIHPDIALGRAALAAARSGVFPLGSRGAGRAATVGKVYGIERAESSGQGGAFRQDSGIQVGVFTVVNALGVIVDRAGRVVRGNYNSETDQRADFHLDASRRLADPPTEDNTTLTVVVTNQKLDGYALSQLGKQVHSSMARAIQPFHTVWDGDVLYTVTTNQVDRIDVTSLGLIASELAWDAVLAAVQHAEQPRVEAGT
jgi:L-aminopeptidase/D-esterase-like protein